MTFDDITGSKKLWSVRLEGEEDNEFLKLFYDWSDVIWLRSFFKENINDLSAYFKITDINQAIKDTIEDSKRLRCVIMDISPEADLSRLFRPLDNNQASDFIASERKGTVETYHQAFVLAASLCYQIDSWRIHHYGGSYQTDGDHAGKRAYKKGTCENG